MECARDGLASSMRVAQKPAAEDGAVAFAGSFRATFTADLIALRSLHSQDAATVVSGSSAGHRQDEQAAITTRTWLRLVRTLCRRFAGRLIVRGTLLNHEELLVTRFRRTPAQSIDRQQEEKSRVHGDSVRVGTRFVVRCVDTETSQIGREVVARILDRDKWSQSVNAAEPVASCGNCLDQQEAWSDEDATRVLERLETIYGFDVRAFAAVLGAERGHEEDEDEEDERPSQVDPTIMDFRAAQHLMRQRHIPYTTGVQSFAMAHHPKYATAIVTQESDARSYRSIDAAQKRRWADERFQYGQELENKARVKDAITEYSSCLKLNETHVQALAARGRLYLQSKQFDESIRDLERVLELDASFPKIGDDLLRAKGTLHHSRHVVRSAPLRTNHLMKQKAVEADTRRNEESRGRPLDRSRGSQTESFRRRSPPPSERLQSAERLRSASSSKNLERDRLRELLEQETWKRDRRRKRSRYSDEDSDDEGSSRRRKETKSAKKKSKKKKSKHKKKHRRTRDRSDSSSSGYSSGDSYARRSPVRGSSRRYKSPSRQPSEEEESVHPILLRQQHRIWK